MSRAFVSPVRLYLLASVVGLAFCVLLGRLVHLHVFEHERLVRIVEHNRENIRTLHARRGNIVDARGNLLASTREVYEVGVDPKVFDLEKSQEKLGELARMLGASEQILVEKCLRRTRTVKGPDGPEQRDVRWVELADAVDQELYKRIVELDIRGIYGNRKFERYYPGGKLAAHLLGFINKEETAVMGVERYMDFYLNGQDGWREYEHDGRQRELAQFRKREVPPADGMHVELTLDLVVQHIVEEEIDRIAREYTPESATIIVSEPATGDVLAMASYPNFDLNHYWEASLDQHRNRATNDIIEPGSTFKAITVAAALNEGVVRANDTFDCSVDVVEYKGRKIRLPGDHHRYGELTVSDIVKKSSNRGAAFLGMELGEDRLYEYARAFGFGEITGIGPAGEENGILHAVEDWDGLTISRMPMGHAVSATPLQIHYAMSVIANDGVLVKPRLIKRVYEEGEEADIRFDPSPRRRVISTQVAREVANMLMGVVGNDGTARRAAIPGFEVAGKTGTTQKIVDGRYSREHHVASFVGFFPASQPRLVVSVIVNDPQLRGLGYGGVVAAPSFHDVSEKLIRYLGIQPVDGNTQYAWKGGPFDWTR